MLNLSCVKSILESEFSINFSNISNDMFWELGGLRNCIVHHDGIIKNEVFRSSLQETIAFLRLRNEVGEIFVLSRDNLGETIN